MKKLAIILFTLSLTACATKPINVATAPSTPPSRIYAPELVVPREGTVELVVARDAGYIGSGCMTAIYLDGRVVSAIDNAEKITFYVTPAGTSSALAQIPRA